MKHLLLKDGTLKEFRRMEMMGIINVTPDSFYEGSRAGSIDEALAKAEQMIRERKGLVHSAYTKALTLKGGNKA